MRKHLLIPAVRQPRRHLGPGDLRHLHVQPGPRLLPHVRAGTMPGRAVLCGREGGKDVQEEDGRPREERPQEHEEQALWLGRRKQRACREWEEPRPRPAGRLVWTQALVEPRAAAAVHHPSASRERCVAVAEQPLQCHERAKLCNRHDRPLMAAAAERVAGDGHHRGPDRGECRLHQAVH